MTSISTARATAVTVALVGASATGAESLAAALVDLPTSDRADWRLRAADGVPTGAVVDIAVCDGTAAVRAAAVRWPDAEILALVSARGDEGSVLGALDAGAHVCVRGSDPAVVAAYVHSITRRRGLLVPDVAR